MKKTPLLKLTKHFPKGHLLVIGGLSVVLLASAMTSHSAKEPEHDSIQLSIDMDKSEPELTIEAPTASIPKAVTPVIEEPITDLEEPAPVMKEPPQPLAETPPPQKVLPEWQTLKVKSGDSLSTLFNRVGLSDVTLYKFLQDNKSAKQLTKLHPGQELSFHINADDNTQLLGVRYQKSRLHRIEYTHSDNGFIDTSTVLEPDVYTAYREATIKSSLFLAGSKANMEESLIMELANIFGWDIDFALDIRTNDSFRVLYEEQFLEGEKIGNGPILAAEFVNQGTSYQAVRYTNSEGNSDYFTPNGKSMRKAFLRTPVDFARISSHFNLKRKHPILNRIRAHKGTDYAAPTGTPIKAAGNGKVIFAGNKGGYGRTLILKHGQTYKTLYAHLHKYGRGIRTGKKVKQGQIIGYVGMSGLATGPHLHYEFHKNGVVRNPVRVPLPKAESVPKSQLKDFKAQTQPLVAKLEQFIQDTQIALAETGENKTDNKAN